LSLAGKNMQIPFGDLSRQYKKYRKEIDEITRDVLSRGVFILGENVRNFEAEFARYCGCRYGIGVGSGTEALHLALLACGIKNGDEVITVANTAIPTVSAIRFAGGVPVFADIDEYSYNIDPAKIEEKITRKTKFIMPVHLYGNPCRMDEILEIAKRYGLKIIEDCAQAHGSAYRGKKAGSFGDAGAFSFYPSKNLGAFGDGGMVITDDEEIARKMMLLRNYGQKDRYFSVMEGYNSRLDELQAAILRFKLRHLDESNIRRMKIAHHYNESFKGLDMICPLPQKDSTHVYHLYVMRVKNRKSFMDYLAGCGISALIHYPYGAHLQDGYRYLGYREGSLPVTEMVCSQIVSIPIFPELEEKEISYIIAKIIASPGSFKVSPD